MPGSILSSFITHGNPMRAQKTKLKVVPKPAASFGEEIKNLNRIRGQVDGIVQMIESGRDIPDILIQLSAMRAAVKSVESRLLQSHIRDELNGETEIEDLLRLIDKKLS